LSSRAKLPKCRQYFLKRSIWTFEVSYAQTEMRPEETGNGGTARLAIEGKFEGHGGDQPGIEKTVGTSTLQSHSLARGTLGFAWQWELSTFEPVINQRSQYIPQRHSPYKLVRSLGFGSKTALGKILAGPLVNYVTRSRLFRLSEPEFVFHF
jgi:hypothetical protein